MNDLVEQAENETLRQMLRHLQGVTMLPGSPDKRFVRDVWQRDPATLTVKQKGYVRRLAFRYRRQLPEGVRLMVDPDNPAAVGKTK